MAALAAPLLSKSRDVLVFNAAGISRQLQRRAPAARRRFRY
jgi:hypothetical protein